MVDCDDGYTRIANELLDAILRFPFSKRELKIVFSVVRKTYGYNKKTDALSMWQIGNLTGISHANVSRSVADLVSKNVLKRGGIGRVSHGQEIAEIGLNKCYLEWGMTIAKTAPVTKQHPLQNSNQTYAKTATPPMPKRQPQKTTPKDNTKRQYMSGYREIAKTVLAFLNEKAGRNYREVDANIGFIVDRLKEGYEEKDFRQVIALKTREWKGDDKMSKFLRPETLFNKTKFAQYTGELGNG